MRPKYLKRLFVSLEIPYQGMKTDKLKNVRSLGEGDVWKDGGGLKTL